MTHSNERGRALEYRVTVEIEHFLRDDLRLEILSTENTKRLNQRDKAYFEALDELTKTDFSVCACTLIKWLKTQDWFSLADHVTIDRFGDEKAKQADPTDIQIGISGKDGILTIKNLSLKHHHDALKHPRLPSLAQQCGLKKDCKDDINYRKLYSQTWLSFGNKVKKLSKKIKVYKQLEPELKFKHLYAPLMQNTVAFLLSHSKKPENAQSLFGYLVGRNNYIVIKNEPKEIVIKDFSSISQPTKFSVVYPYKEKDNDPRNYFLLAFNNGWKIRVRIHNASSRIFKPNGEVFATEKMDPICVNLESLIKTEKESKIN